MRYKSIGANITGNDTLLTVPSDVRAIVVSLNISNKDTAGADVSIKINKGVDTYYLLKDSYIHPNSLVNVISEDLYLDKDDSIDIEATGVDLDTYLSYKEVVVFPQFI
jgi:hypothetical protein